MITKPKQQQKTDKNSTNRRKKKQNGVLTCAQDNYLTQCPRRDHPQRFKLELNGENPHGDKVRKNCQGNGKTVPTTQLRKRGNHHMKIQTF